MQELKVLKNIQQKNQLSFSIPGYVPGKKKAAMSRRLLRLADLPSIFRYQIQAT